MRRNTYVAAFVIILLFACVGGFLGGRVLLTRLQQDFGVREEATPGPVTTAITELDASPAATAESTAADDHALSPEPQTTRATATIMVVPAPVTDQPLLEAATPAPTWTAGVYLPKTEYTAPETPFDFSLDSTPEPSATPRPAFPFSISRSVRYTSGDCPGTYALGIVTDQVGNPLPNVRLSLVDEYGNAMTAVTKPGPGDTGRYDFPMGGPPRRFYLSIVDEAGNTLSPRIEILHDLAPQEGKGCRWVDWRRS